MEAPGMEWNRIMAWMELEDRPNGFYSIEKNYIFFAVRWKRHTYPPAPDFERVLVIWCILILIIFLSKYCQCINITIYDREKKKNNDNKNNIHKRAKLGQEIFIEAASGSVSIGGSDKWICVLKKEKIKTNKNVFTLLKKTNIPSNLKTRTHHFPEIFVAIASG